MWEGISILHLPPTRPRSLRVVFGVLGAGLKWNVGGEWLGCITGSEEERMKMNCSESLGKGGLKRRRQRNAA